MLGRIPQGSTPPPIDPIVTYLSTHFLKEGQ
jgi:hypothetical protein